MIAGAEAATPYADAREHLWDELRRIDQLARGQTVRWHSTLAVGKAESLWGMAHVTEAEVQAYLEAPFTPPDRLPPVLEERLEPFRREAESLRRAIDARVEATDDPLPLERMVRIFGLSGLERDLLLACVLAELDVRYRRLFAYLQDDASRPALSIELLLQLLRPVAPDPADVLTAVRADGPLLVLRLLAWVEGPESARPLAARAVRVDERVLAHVLGADALDGRLVGVVRGDDEVRRWEALVVADEERERLRRLGRWLAARAQDEGLRAAVSLTGPYGSGRLDAVRALAADVGVPLLVADVDAALRAPDRWETTVELAFREAALRSAALAWVEVDALIGSDEAAPLWNGLLAATERAPGLTLFVSRAGWDPVARLRDHAAVRIDLRPPGYELRRRFWQQWLPAQHDFAEPSPDRRLLAERLANGFQLTPGQMWDALALARSISLRRDPDEPRLTADDLYEACRRQSGRGLVTFTRRIEPRTDLTFDDLVLPPASDLQLVELRRRIHNRGRVFAGLGLERRVTLGRGLVALFTGSSGTGKTMAAELLAREQGVDLYKVDLSAVVSKYVGETEKNLSAVFADAEDANAVVFFDECDALFGKRGEVKDARDRWANIEVDYLLQRVEEYAGVVVLASNLRQNIDEGFLRRIDVIVEFPFPDEKARLRILHGLFPPNLQRPGDEELRQLAARFRLAGGSLKNIVVDAVFRALDGDMPPRIELRHLVDSTGREYQKLGKPITIGEFGEHFYDWVREDILEGAEA